MKRKIFALLVAISLTGLITGCVETVDGRSQVGVPFVKDTVEGRYERPVGQVVEAAKAVINFNGKLTADNSVNNSLEGKVNETTVYVHVEEIDTKPVTRVQVQARTRAGGSDVGLAHEIEKQIALQLVGR